MNRKQVIADLREYIEFAYDDELEVLSRELLAKGYSQKQLRIIQETREIFDDWYNFTSEYNYDDINCEVNVMIERTADKVMGKDTAEAATEVNDETEIDVAEAEAVAEAETPEVKAHEVKAPVKVKNAKVKTVKAVNTKTVKANAPVKITIKAPAKKAENDAKKAPKTSEPDNRVIKVLANTSKSKIGEFIVHTTEDNPGITFSGLADKICTSFVTKTGIKPDAKWAVRNIELFISKGLIKAE